MEILNRIRKLKEERKAVTAVTLLGCAGMLLILISSLTAENGSIKGEKGKVKDVSSTAAQTTEKYRIGTEKEIEEFLQSIDGVGKAEVYLTVSGESRTVYATEGRKSISDSKTEEERKYVMTGSGNEKNALIETVEAPQISGAVIACTGSDDPRVQEAVYRAVSTALGIPTSKVYVTKLKGEKQ